MVRASWHRPLLALVAASVLFTPSGLVSAQEDGDGAPTTALTFSGSLDGSVNGSDGNACVYENGDLRVQLLGATDSSILSFSVSNAAAGDLPVGASSGPKVSMVTLSDDPNEFLVNWYGKSGTLTLSSLDSRVPVGDGSVSTRGATGSIDADVAADKHGTVHISGAWACHMPTAL